MSNGFYQWIQDLLNHKYLRKHGALIDADYRYVERSRLDFVNALITEVGFPALDAASKAACRMTVKFAPEYTRMQKANGAASRNPYPGRARIRSGSRPTFGSRLTAWRKRARA
jgi:hypothetical protein